MNQNIENKNKFQNSLRNLLSWFLDIRSSALDLEGEHRPEEVAGHIANCYRVLDLTPGNFNYSITSLPITEDYFKEDQNYRKSVKELTNFVNSSLKKYITHFYLHGSLATLDYKQGWSDLDTFMVIKKEVVTDRKSLLELRKLCLDAWPLFLSVTPLQHHGFIVVTEFDLDSYASHFLPPVVLNHSLSLLHGQPQLNIKVYPDGGLGSLNSLKSRGMVLNQAIKSGTFKHHPKNGVYLSAEFKNADDNMYQLFCFLGYIMTVPAYFLDAAGKSVYKKDSFEKAKPYFSENEWRIINKATQIRNEWPKREGVKYRGNKIPVWVQEILGKNYLSEGLSLIQKAITAADRIKKNQNV